MTRGRWMLLAAEAAALVLIMTTDWSGGASVAADNTVLLPEERPKYVALTFDDGPFAGSTDRLLDGLQARGAKATFFLIGQQMELYPDTVRRMAAEGHQVGAHTWNHVRLAEADDATVTAELTRTDAYLRELLGEGEYWVRVPYGLIRDDQRHLFPGPLIQWSVDPEDWRLRDADAVTAAVLAAVEPGDIILLHDTLETSVDAALRIVDELQAKGYEFLTVRELLERSGVTPEAGVRYRSVKNIGAGK